MAYAVALRTEAYTAATKIEGFQCLDQARATRRSDGQPPLGDKPLVVLMRGKRGELGATDSDERAWVEMQEELTASLVQQQTPFPGKERPSDRFRSAGSGSRGHSPRSPASGEKTVDGIQRRLTDAQWQVINALLA